MGHMAHKDCAENLRRAGKLHLRGGCPLCDDLLKRSKMGMAPAGAPQKLYCTDVFGGFASTAKLERGKAEIEETCGKRGEKSIFFSCSKATLDLFEALTTHHIQGVAAYRYDGDIDASERRKVLAQFKKHAGGAVLFATVQTAGVGLNIVEANNVVFTDRWFNPAAHSQAEDRTHRIGQTRPVRVKYLDGEDTIDVVFKKVHEFKSDNARVAMAGEGDLPSLAKKKVSFRDMRDLIRGAFDALWNEREKKMGIEKLLHAVYDNADPHAAAPVVAAAPQPLGGAARGRAVDWKPPKREPADRAGGPVPFDYAAAVGDPWRPLKREPKAEAVIDLRGDSDVEMMVAAPTAPPAPIEIDSDAAPSPIAVDADGEPWTCARCTYAENRPCFLCCEMCGGERA